MPLGESVHWVSISCKINKCVKDLDCNYHESLLSLSFLYLRSTNLKYYILTLLRLPVPVTLGFYSQYMDLY